MRENKFRGVSVETGKFVYGGLVKARTKKGNCWAIKDTIYNINNGKLNIIPEVVKPETVGQYIEIKDINGKDIYEGDRINHWHEELFFEGYVDGIIEWGKEMCCWMIGYDSCSQSIANLDVNYAILKVVGNIHEK